MFFDILKRDIRRKKTMNSIILLFVVLAVTFISSSVNNLTAITSSLDTYFDQAGVGDYVVIERGTVGKSAAEIADQLDYVEDVSTEPVLYNTDGIQFHGKTVTAADIVIISSIDNQIQKFYDSDNMEIKQVPEGSVYIRKNYLDDVGISIGDQVTVPITARGSIALSEEDINLMAAVMTLECGGESYEGQLAVANVILNRLQSGRWGSSMSGVVYAPSQFTVVNSANFNTYISPSCLQAARDACAGTNNIGGYTSFRPLYNIDTSTLDSYTIIGNHCFF